MYSISFLGVCEIVFDVKTIQINISTTHRSFIAIVVRANLRCVRPNM